MIVMCIVCGCHPKRSELSHEDMLPLWVGLTRDQTLAFRAPYRRRLIMQNCKVTCIVREQVLASFPGSSPALYHILYKTVHDKKLGRSLGTSSRYCSCHYMQCNANLIGLRCSCKVITSCCFRTVNEHYVNKVAYSCKLRVMYINCIMQGTTRIH